MKGKSVTLQGVAASPGIGIGEVRVLNFDELRVSDRSVGAAEVGAEVARFEQALTEAARELGEIRACYAEDMGEASALILDAQLLLLSDPVMRESTIKVVRSELRSAAWAFRDVLAGARHHLESSENEYMRDRAADFLDVERRVLHHLLSRSSAGLRDLAGPSVLVAHDLPPSETVLMHPDKVLGFALETGGRTSHSVIVARSRGIPAVVGVHGALREVHDGDMLIVDGNDGVIEVNPDEATLHRYRQKLKDFQEFETRLEQNRDLPAVTLDGRRIQLLANIEVPEEAEGLRRRGAEGVGLFRTEFFYLNHASLPTEEEQYAAYSAVARAMAPDLVVIRTMDVGGDKVTSYMGASPEDNPFQGWRGIRYSLAHEDIFKTQLRAIYRASAHGELCIMIPMVTRIEEIERTRELCAEVRQELVGAGIPCSPDIKLGIMVETPAAVMIADHLAGVSDFFSIGTNDLLQYTLAVDRGNERTSHLYEPLDVAMLRSISRVVEEGHKRGIWISVCGEMSNDPLACVALAGLGVDKISTSPFGLPGIKSILRSISCAEARQWMEQALQLQTAAQVRQLLRAHLTQASEILRWA